MASYSALDVRFASGPGAGALQDLLYAALDDFGPLAIHDLATGDGWRVFFPSADQRDLAHHSLASSLGGQVVDLTPAEVDDEDWARRSQAALTSVRIGRFIVAPPWDVPPSRGAGCGVRDPGSRLTDAGFWPTHPGSRIPHPAEIVIVIEPSTGFGTGHHATTRLCLELLQEIDVTGRRVIDVGTGSGLLAIAAWKLGAASVVALDNDPEALHNARANLARNGAETHVEIVEGDLERVSLAPGDIVMANLTGAMLQRCSPALMALANPGATAILSGFGPEDGHAIASAWIGWSVRDRKRDGEWATVSLVSRTAPTGV